MKKNRFVLAILFVLSMCLSNAQITWEPVDGIPEGNIDLISISPDNHIYIKYYEDESWSLNDSLYRSTDNGFSWNQITFFDSCGINDIFFANKNDVFIGVGVWAMGGYEGKRGIMYSGDSGENWSHRYIDEPGCAHIDKVTMNRAGNLIAFNDMGDVFQLSDNGEEWEAIFNCATFEGGCLSSTDGWNNTLGANDIAFSINNNYYLCTSRGLAVSNNKGENWNMVNLRESVNCITLYDNNDIVVGTEDGHGLFYYNTANDNWTNIGLVDRKIGTIISQNNETLFVATQDSGIYYTNNNGISWIRTNEGLDTLGIISMVSSPEGYLYVVTEANMVFKSGEILVGIKDISNTNSIFTLDQNYPNPFHLKTTISYHLPVSEEVELSIYDLFGRKISTLLKEHQLAGTYNQEWNAEGTKPGIYFSKLKAGQSWQVRKMILLK